MMLASICAGQSLSSHYLPNTGLINPSLSMFLLAQSIHLNHRLSSFCNSIAALIQISMLLVMFAWTFSNCHQTYVSLAVHLFCLQGSWKPTYNVHTILTSICVLLEEPNYLDALHVITPQNADSSASLEQAVPTTAVESRDGPVVKKKSISMRMPTAPATAQFILYLKYFCCFVGVTALHIKLIDAP